MKPGQWATGLDEVRSDSSSSQPHNVVNPHGQKVLSTAGHSLKPSVLIDSSPNDKIGPA